MKTFIAAALVMLAAGHYNADPISDAEAEVISTASRSSMPTTTLQLSGTDYRSAGMNEAISADVDEAAVHLDHALAQAPHVATAMARSIGEHGPVKAILYEDAEVKSATDNLAESLGRGLRALGHAIARDMTEATKQLHSNPG